MVRSNLHDVKCATTLVSDLWPFYIAILYFRLYQEGLNPHLQKLYPEVSFPVSQETPMLSHLVEWKHSEDW